MDIVVNASPLILLCKVGQEKLLCRLSRTVAFAIAEAGHLGVW